MNKTTTRNATLGDLATLLQEQNARKLDIVAPAERIRSENGVLVVEGAEAQIDEFGVTNTDGHYRPTSVCDEGIAGKLNIPLAYVRKIRAERPDIFDANVNGWLQGRVDPEGDSAQSDPDHRSFLLRTFRPDDEGGEGIARAFLSDSYKVIDHLDVLTAALDGVRRSGVEIDIDGCDLSDRRLYVRVKAPQVAELAPELLKGYRSPFTGASGADNPTVFAGFVISNSETGNGSFAITPRLIVKVCDNGMTLTKDAVRAVHLGGRLDEGIVRWSEDTQLKQLELVTAKASDAVTTFLDVDYVRTQIRALEELSGVRLNNSAKVIETVGKRLFNEEQTAGILDHFISAGDVTSGGVFQAVTSFAQTVEDPDTAFELEAAAPKALALAASEASA